MNRTVFPAEQDSSTAGLLSALKAANVQQRIDAYAKLKRDQDALNRPDVRLS
jgi:hypothetical protein